MILNCFLLILGLTLLVIASNKFVDASSSLANCYKVPKMIIALTIAAFGTCTPELAISFNSISEHNYDITIANVLGSSIINILLIIGIASVIKPIKIKTATVKKELPILVITTFLFTVLFLDNILSRLDCLILIFMFFVFSVYLFNMIKKFKKLETEEPKYNKLISIGITVLSLIVIMLSSDVVVDSALYISNTLNISPKLISMVLIVIGTSLPELAITVTSAKKGEFDMTVGNIIGTNIFNICIVLGLPILIYGDVVSFAFNYVDLFVVFLSSLLFYILSKSKQEINRYEGILMLFIVVLYYCYLFLI